MLFRFSTFGHGPPRLLRPGEDGRRASLARTAGGGCPYAIDNGGGCPYAIDNGGGCPYAIDNGGGGPYATNIGGAAVPTAYLPYFSCRNAPTSFSSPA